MTATLHSNMHSNLQRTMQSTLRPTLRPRMQRSPRADRITCRRAHLPSVMSTGDDTVHRCANYAVRRAAAGLLVVLLVSSVTLAGSELLGAVVDVGGRPAAASVSAAGTAPDVRIHVAQPGDTLWSIADRYRGDVGHGRFVDALIDANGATVIEIGQAVRLP